jgi:hypothetical protein
MVQFDYDKEMKRYYVLVPQIIANEESMLIVAHIDEYNKITVTKEIHVSLLRTILLHWDEYEFQLTKGDI